MLNLPYDSMIDTNELRFERGARGKKLNISHVSGGKVPHFPTIYGQRL